MSPSPLSAATSCTLFTQITEYRGPRTEIHVILAATNRWKNRQVITVF